jgi:hypothetical protein
MKRHPLYSVLSLVAIVCLGLAGCGGLTHPLETVWDPADGSTIFLPAPGSSYPLRVTATTNLPVALGLFQIVSTLSDNGRVIYRTPLAEINSGGFSLNVPWMPTSIGDHYLLLNVEYTVIRDDLGRLPPGSHGHFLEWSRVCVLNNFAYAYSGLGVGTHAYCVPVLWFLFGRLTPSERAGPVPPPPPPPAGSATPIQLTPHVVQPLPTDTPTATLTSTAVYCPKGTILIPSLGKCYYATRTPKPQGTAAPACASYKNPSACTLNGCSWDKVPSTCH